MVLTLKTDCTLEPVSLDEVKANIRSDSVLEDAFLDSCLKSARNHIEKLCGPLITQSWYQYEDDWPSGDILYIGKPHLLTVVAVKYTDEDGVTRTMPATDYVVDVKNEFRPRIVVDVDDNTDWPTEELAEVNPIEIEFTCGYGATASTVPEPIKWAIILHATNRYINRIPDAASEKAVEDVVGSLIANYRYWGF